MEAQAYQFTRRNNIEKEMKYMYNFKSGTDLLVFSVGFELHCCGGKQTFLTENRLSPSWSTVEATYCICLCQGSPVCTCTVFLRIIAAPLHSSLYEYIVAVQTLVVQKPYKGVAATIRGYGFRSMLFNRRGRGTVHHRVDR